MMKPLSLLLVFVLILSLCACGGTPQSSSEAPPPSSPEASDDLTLSIKIAAAHESIRSILNDAVGPDCYTVESGGLSNDSIVFIIHLWQDGLAAELDELKASGAGADAPRWVEVKDSMMSLYGSMRDALETGGCENASLTLEVINDDNQVGNILLTILQGEITFDIMEE